MGSAAPLSGGAAVVVTDQRPAAVARSGAGLSGVTAAVLQSVGYQRAALGGCAARRAARAQRLQGLAHARATRTPQARVARISRATWLVARAAHVTRAALAEVTARTRAAAAARLSAAAAHAHSRRTDIPRGARRAAARLAGRAAMRAHPRGTRRAVGARRARAARLAAGTTRATAPRVALCARVAHPRAAAQLPGCAAGFASMRERAAGTHGARAPCTTRLAGTAARDTRARVVTRLARRADRSVRAARLPRATGRARIRGRAHLVCAADLPARAAVPARATCAARVERRIGKDRAVELSEVPRRLRDVHATAVVAARLIRFFAELLGGARGVGHLRAAVGREQALAREKHWEPRGAARCELKAYGAAQREGRRDAFDQEGHGAVAMLWAGGCDGERCRKRDASVALTANPDVVPRRIGARHDARTYAHADRERDRGRQIRAHEDADGRRLGEAPAQRDADE